MSAVDTAAHGQIANAKNSLRQLDLVLRRAEKLPGSGPALQQLQARKTLQDLYDTLTSIQNNYLDATRSTNGL